MSTREEVIDFLETIARPDANLDNLTDEVNLVDTGVIDSLSVIQIVMHLETEHHKDLGAVDMGTLVSIQGILDVIHS